MARIAILGAGAFGTALALHSHAKGHRVRLWSFEKGLPAQVRRKAESPFLPGFPIPDEIELDHELGFVLDDADLVLLVTPAQFVRDVSNAARPLLPEKALIGCCAKGIEHDSLELMSAVLARTLPRSVRRHAFLSGPTFAKELASGLPMDIAVASDEPDVGSGIQELLHSPTFRVYTSRDPIGVEVAGALKNVIAIACGAADELGLGLSARGSLLARGLAEITRIGVKLGANPVTFLGLAGVGDLILTCTGDLSRNRTLGRQIAAGEKAADILARQSAIAEGYYTAGPAFELARKLGVDAPIIEQVYHVLHEDRTLGDAMERLITRERKGEFDGILP